MDDSTKDAGETTSPSGKGPGGEIPPAATPQVVGRTFWDAIRVVGPNWFVVLTVAYVGFGLVLLGVTYALHLPFKYPPGIETDFSGLGGVRESSLGHGTDSLLITQIIGTFHGGRAPMVRVLSKSSADSANAALMLEATSSIKIVTVHGGSWITEFQVKPSFEAAIRRARVELLLVDPSGAALSSLLASDHHGLERGWGKDRLAAFRFRDQFAIYRKYARPESTANHLSVRFYTRYPWIRFSIYDGRRATFVLVPFLKSGRESPVFFTDDPWLIECLQRVFDDFNASSRSIEHDEDFDRLWQPWPGGR